MSAELFNFSSRSDNLIQTSNLITGQLGSSFDHRSRENCHHHHHHHLYHHHHNHYHHHHHQEVNLMRRLSENRGRNISSKTFPFSKKHLGKRLFTWSLHTPPTKTKIRPKYLEHKFPIFKDSLVKKENFQLVVTYRYKY